MQSWQYIALLGAVIAVTAAILPKNKKYQAASGSNHAQFEQLEMSFEQFMENMEKEHDGLVKMLTTSLQTMREEDRLKTDQITRLEKKCSELEEQLSSLSHANVALETKLSLLAANTHFTSQSSAQDMQHAAFDSQLEQLKQSIIPENSIHNRYVELFELYDNGKSVEAIAKKLGKNKGEVQLILQLAKQEENARNA
ncbi:DUF6115 domain-containing protein [Paenibacillus endoradicis]|uniref:DUF6115 domain-containing protein n=1 Tax=Paenibacillus endoradicis TaxID=2972487 RepID=UPI002159450B|nr:hypothetical protein [Paenibacillus endoradicis]MCR8656280.1 hypothetical protein [Paenibacillus endoradicis]